MVVTDEQAERLITAVERCAEALELLSTAYVHHMMLEQGEVFREADLADTHEELVQKKWARSSVVP